MKNLKIVEIFESIQGEGANAGMLAIFIRLSFCNKNCWYCDTKWNEGKEMSINEIKCILSGFKSKTIIWTGGEPTIQLTEEILTQFEEYYNCIETNGTNHVPKGISYISCSPKVTVEELNINFPNGLNEIRYPVSKETIIPNIKDLPKAKHYFLSPVFLGKQNERFAINKNNIKKCINLIKNQPSWKMSIQMHKLLKIR